MVGRVSGRTRVARHWIALIGALLVLTGCEVGLSLDIDLRSDGTSLVTFVVKADAEVMDDVDVAALRLDDIAGQGWAVVGPVVADDGSTTLTLSADVADVADLASVIEKLDDGRFFSVAEASVIASIGTTDYDLVVTVDPTLSAETFSSEAIADLLDGEPFGITLSDIERRAGRPLDETISISATVRAPGSGDDARGTVRVTLADDEVGVAAASSQLVDDDVFAARDVAAVAREDVDSAWKRLARYWLAAVVVAAAALLVTRRRKPTPQLPTI